MQSHKQEYQSDRQYMQSHMWEKQSDKKAKDAYIVEYQRQNQDLMDERILDLGDSGRDYEIRWLIFKFAYSRTPSY